MNTVEGQHLVCERALRVALTWFGILFVSVRVAWSGPLGGTDEKADAVFRLRGWQGSQTVAWEPRSNYCVVVLTDNSPLAPSDRLLYAFGSKDPSRATVLVPKGVKRFACVSLESETGRRIEVPKYVREKRLVCCAGVRTLPVNRYRKVLGVKKLARVSVIGKSRGTLLELFAFSELFGELEPGNYAVHVTFQALEPLPTHGSPDFTVLTFPTVHIPLVVPRMEKRTAADGNAPTTAGQVSVGVKRGIAGDTLEVADQSARMTLPYISVCLMILCTMIFAARLGC